MPVPANRPQSPYPIVGQVKLNERASGADVYTVQEGAIVWAQDITEGTFKYSEKNVSLVYTNSKGQYIIDVANITTQYATGDTIRVYAKAGGRYTFIDVKIDTNQGISKVDFNFTHKSELTDGLKGTLDTGGQYGLESIGRGMKKGMKDGMQ